MRILHCASELYPLISTGGLGSVVSALPGALSRFAGLETAVAIPFYGEIAEKVGDVKWHPALRTEAGEEFGVAETCLNGLRILLVAKNEFFQRRGIYGPGSGYEWPDNPERYSFFSRAVVALVRKGVFSADLVHCHDWQTALVPVYMRNGNIPTVYTIHNLKFQGQFGSESWHAAELPDTLYTVDGLEFWGNWNCMKGGIIFADMVTTVSPTYADEIMTEDFGWGLDGVLRSFRGKVVGILNGIDTRLWDPASDPALPAAYCSGKMAGKSLCRKMLLRDSGFEPSGGPLLGMVGRLTTQKGIDTVIKGLDRIIELGCRLKVVGTGELQWEKALASAASRYPGRVSVSLEYNDTLARSVFAGADAFLMPSRFEPCGLAQMMAMRYGTVPLVRETGGLADTVDEKRGFSFRGGQSEFVRALEELCSAWSNRGSWAWYRRRCMAADFSWEPGVREYSKVYEGAIEKR